MKNSLTYIFILALFFLAAPAFMAQAVAQEDAGSEASLKASPPRATSPTEGDDEDKLMWWAELPLRISCDRGNDKLDGCLKALLEPVEADLDLLYQKILSDSGETAEKFIDAQKAWLIFRDQDGAYRYGEGGGSGDIQYVKSKYKHTLRRIADLREYLTIRRNSGLCSESISDSDKPSGLCKKVDCSPEGCSDEIIERRSEEKMERRKVLGLQYGYGPYLYCQPCDNKKAEALNSQAEAIMKAADEELEALYDTQLGYLLNSEHMDPSSERIEKLDLMTLDISVRTSAEKLTDAQKAWALFRDKDCEYWLSGFPIGGDSSEALEKLKCTYQHTLRRSADLREYVGCRSDDCPH